MKGIYQYKFFNSTKLIFFKNYFIKKNFYKNKSFNFFSTHINSQSNRQPKFLNQTNDISFSLSKFNFSDKYDNNNKEDKDNTEKPEVSNKKFSFKKFKVKLKKYGFKGLLVYYVVYISGILIIYGMLENKIINGNFIS